MTQDSFLFTPPGQAGGVGDRGRESSELTSTSRAASEGARLRDEGLALVDAHEDLAWKRRADEAIAALARLGSEFGGEEVRAIAGSPQRPNSMGARFNAAARAGLIVYVKHKPSNRSSLHRCKVAVWVGK